jgi:hypothetical protein
MKSGSNLWYIRDRGETMKGPLKFILQSSFHQLCLDTLYHTASFWLPEEQLLTQTNCLGTYTNRGKK